MTAQLAFLHDSDASRDPKILSLIRAGSWEAYGLWWAIVENLRSANLNRLKRTDIDALAWGMHIETEKLTKVIDLCIQFGLLEEKEGCFFSPSLDERIAAYENGKKETSDSMRELALKRWGKEKAINDLNPKPCDGMRADAANNTIQPNIIEDNTIQNKEGIQGESKPNLQVVSAQPETPPEPEPPLDPFEKYFQQIEPELSTGRRPLKEYPHLFFLPNELKSVLAAFNSRELPKVFFKDVFAVAESEAVSRHAKTGANPAHTNCSSWIMGHILTKFIEQNGQLIRTKKASQPFQKVDNVRPNYSTPKEPERVPKPLTDAERIALDEAILKARNFKAPKAEKSSLVVVSK